MMMVRQVLSLGLIVAMLLATRVMAGSGEGLPSLTSMPELRVAAPNGTNRVTAAAVFQPGTAAPGDTVDLLLKVRVAPGHWVYALAESGSRNIALTVTTPADAPFQPARAWVGPEAKVKGDGSRTYAGEVLLRGRFQVDRGAGDGVHRLPVTLAYQVCNEALCWPPATISLEPALRVIPSR